jgi:hypothetical protein
MATRSTSGGRRPKRLAAHCLSLSLTAVLAASCYMTVREGPLQLSHQKTEGRILSVQMNYGEVFEFPKGRPAYIDGGMVVGDVLEKVTYRPDEVEGVSKAPDGKTLIVALADGSDVEAVSAVNQDGRIVCEVFSPVEIPVKDIRIAKVRRPNETANAILAGLGVAAIVVGGYLLDPHGDYTPDEDDVESCPLVYSYDGRGYVLDAEPYGTAVCSGLQRTDWISLDGLAAVDGQYKVVLSNELDETQYTDELKLVVVDHPAGAEVVPELYGRLHTFAAPVAPRLARDRKGRDILPLIAKDDGGFWVSRLEEKDPSRAEDLRDELTIEFAKPAGATRVKFLSNAWTTRWGSQAIRKFLEVRGDALPAWYANVDAHGAEWSGILDWQMREELYLLKVWVETKDGWKVRGLIAGGGPYVSKDRACVLDIRDVPGDTLRIRLRPPVNFWMLNRLAVEFGDDLPLRTVELAAASAVDQDGRDVRAKLAASEGNYLAAAERGDMTTVAFTAPPDPPGLERTVFVKAAGYYEIHIRPSGPPRTELLARITDEPGYAARFALEEYLKREQRVRTRRALR